MADATGLRAGFIGLGVMGRPMAGHILEAGFPLTVASRDVRIEHGGRRVGQLGGGHVAGLEPGLVGELEDGRHRREGHWIHRDRVVVRLPARPVHSWHCLRNRDSAQNPGHGGQRALWRFINSYRAAIFGQLSGRSTQITQGATVVSLTQ